MTRQPPYELILSLIVVVAVTAWYVRLAESEVPRPSGLVGHGLGIAGFLLMLSTETLYTLRKRLRGFTVFQMSTWLRIHIFTGIVGPYLVLLHSGWKFNGLAGVLTLLTVVMVLSGFVGRHIYTAVPRTLDGVELAVRDLEDRIVAADLRLQKLGISLAERVDLAAVIEVPERGWKLVLRRKQLLRRHQEQLRRAMQGLRAAAGAPAAQLQGLLEERYRLQLQINALAETRRLLSLWHLFHVPLGVMVFMLAFIHIGAALYYAAFLT
jgi:hypothetical protein